MFKVALVGHSQIPVGFQSSEPNVEVRLFRAPGALVDGFNNNRRLTSVLQWPHDLTILWLGSNDIRDSTDPSELAGRILTIARTIEDHCQSRVIVSEVEKRVYPPNHPHFFSNERYLRVRRSVNRNLLRTRQFLIINFNSVRFVLAHDGIHFRAHSQNNIRDKLNYLIRTYRSRV